VGDLVVCGRNAIAQLGVANGTRGTVAGLDPEARTLTIRVHGKDPREVVLPGWYLDGRQRGDRNRRVDLAYATTGHRAQGLTRWRALVRLTGTEDSNWLYVQLSRARHETTLYPVVGPVALGWSARQPSAPATLVPPHWTMWSTIAASSTTQLPASPGQERLSFASRSSTGARATCPAVGGCGLPTGPSPGPSAISTHRCQSLLMCRRLCHFG
jgi:hypothetical protein